MVGIQNNLHWNETIELAKEYVWMDIQIKNNKRAACYTRELKLVTYLFVKSNHLNIDETFLQMYSWVLPPNQMKITPPHIHTLTQTHKNLFYL